MTLPQISMAFNNKVLFFVHTACRPWVCFDSTLYHHPEDRAKGATPAYNAAGYMAAGKEQWQNHMRALKLPFREDSHSSAYISLGKASHVAKPDGNEVGGTTLCREAPGNEGNKYLSFDTM